MFALALLSLVAVQEPAPADAPPADAVGSWGPVEAAPVEAAPVEGAALVDGTAFADGTAYYDRLEFEKASFRFRAATRASAAPSELARANLWLGLALAQAGDEIGAREAFIDALTLDDAVALPADAPPTIRPIFDDARALRATPSGDTSAPVVAPADEGVPLLTIVGATIVGVSVLSLGGGAVMGALALSRADASQEAEFQDEAIALNDEAVATAAIANALLFAGATAAVAGAAIVVGGQLVE